MIRRMLINVINKDNVEKWVISDYHLIQGKWMEGSPPSWINPGETVEIRSEKRTGETHGTTGSVRYASTLQPGSTITITWNKPYGHDATDCFVDVNSLNYKAEVKNQNFDSKEGKEIGKCDVVISHNDSPNLIDTKTWMGKLPANTKLNNVIMPGSHDAGMSKLVNCSVFANDSNTQTQQLDIQGQLEAGSRYFDIRVDYDKKKLTTYHRTDVIGIGFGCSGQLLEDVMRQTVNFLRENKTETAILKFSHIRGNAKEKADVKERIKKMLQSAEFAGYMFKGSDNNLANLNLTESAGKFVAVMDYDEGIDPAMGFFRFHDGFNDKGICAYHGLNVTVCDLYSDTNSYEKMSADQITKWNNYAGFGKDYLFLLSWTLTTGSSGSIRDLARVANDHLPEVLNSQININKKGKPNIVYIDFVNVATAREIINYNF